MEFDLIFNILCNVLDWLIILIMVWLLYRLIRSNTRTQQIVKGAVIFALLKGISVLLDLKMVSWVMNYIMPIGILSVIVVFQPEIRLALQKMGTRSVFVANPRNQLNDLAAKELRQSLLKFSASKTGALITIEKNISLDEYIPSGTIIDASISEALIGTIFFDKTPLHDGAVVVRGGRLLAAGVFYPSTNKVVSKSHGARHRAAVAISEITDSVTFIVSEETGKISVAQSGKIAVLKENDIQHYIYQHLMSEKEEGGLRWKFINIPSEWAEITKWFKQKA